MSSVPVGIHDLSLALPRYRIRLSDLVARRLADDPGFTDRLNRAMATTGQTSMRFPAPWEDPVTLAAEALKSLLKARTDLVPAHLRFLAAGTETTVDLSKSLASYVLGLVQSAGCPLPSNLATYQTQQACVGGTLAVLTIAGFLQASGRDDDAALVLTSDIARYKAPSTAEITQGGGASALWIARHPDLLELDLPTAGFASRDVDDFFRPLGSVIAKVKGGYSQQCYHETLVAAFEDHCRRASADPAEELETTDAFFLHAPYARMPVSAMEVLLAKFLGLDAQGAREFLAARGFFTALEATAQVGNLYTGSIYLNLAFGLSERVAVWGAQTPGKKVLLASYGSGNTMAVVSGVLASRAEATVKRWAWDGLLSDFEEPGFEAYLNWIGRDERGGGAGEPGRFALTGQREDGYREYRLV